MQRNLQHTENYLLAERFDFIPKGKTFINATKGQVNFSYI